VRSILAVPRAVLRQAFAGRTLLVFDLDGTLAPIAATPASVRLRRSTRRLLAQVATRFPTVVLTGRDRRDAARHLRGIPLKMIVGNHGLDLGGGGSMRIVNAWERQLRERRAALPGILVERKRLSIAAHYRGAEDTALARRRVMRVVQGLSPPPRIVGGKELVNLLPDIGIDKGTALRRLVRHFRARAALFVGDDASDEDAFKAGNSYSVLTVRVGTSSRTAAQFALATQPLIDTLLAHLLDARPELNGARPKRYG
jgi:trehalose 6-phosphate phosphatase